MKNTDKLWLKLLLCWLIINITAGNDLISDQPYLVAAPVLTGKFKTLNQKILQVEGTDINISAPHLNIDNEILDVTLEIANAGNKEIEKLNYRIKLSQAKAQSHLPDITEGKVSIHFKL